MAERELAILVKARDLSSPVIKGIKREFNTLGKTVGQGMSSLSRNIQRGMVAIGTAAVAGIGYALKAAGDFEAQLNTINTVAMASPEVLGQIGEGIRQLARDTGTSHADLTTSYYDLVSAGIKAADAQDVLTHANTLAIGGLSTTAEAVDLLTTAINSYGGDASKAGEYADQFAKAIERGKVTAAEIAAGFAQVGPMAAAMGIGVDEISASLGLMTAKGTPAAESFTQMRAAMVALQRQTPAMTRVLGELGIENAQLYADTYGLAPLYDKLARKAAELGIPMIELTGRVEGTQYALQNTGPAFDAYVENLEAVQDASGTAAAQMSERQQGFNYQLGRMKVLAHDAAITVGNALLPKIVPRIKELVEWLAGHQDEVAKFGQGVADAFDDVVAALGKVPWEKVGSALQIAGTGAKAVMDAFLGAPGWLQTAILTGWGLNKLTGGMIGTLVSELGKGLIRGVLGINAGVVNVRGAVVNGPVGPGVGGKPTGGGGKFPWLGVAGAISVPLILSGSDNPEAARGNAQIKLDRGEITQAEFDRLWAHTPLGKGVAGGQKSFGGKELRDAVKDGVSSLPDTAMFLGQMGALVGAERSEGAMARAALAGVRAEVAGKGAAQLVKQSEALAAVRATHSPLSVIAGKSFNPIIKVDSRTNVNVSVHEWKRIERSATTAYSTNSGGI